MGYFGLGFRNYILMRQLTAETTNGAIDIFTDPKVLIIGRFGSEFIINKGNKGGASGFDNAATYSDSQYQYGIYSAPPSYFESDFKINGQNFSNYNSW